MQIHLAAISQWRLFEENGQHPNIKVLIRFLKDLTRRFEAFSPLSPWILDLITNFSVTNNPLHEKSADKKQAEGDRAKDEKVQTTMINMAEKFKRTVEEGQESGEVARTDQAKTVEKMLREMRNGDLTTVIDSAEVQTLEEEESQARAQTWAEEENQTRAEKEAQARVEEKAQMEPEKESGEEVENFF